MTENKKQEPDKELLQQLVENEPQVIEILPSDISISVHEKDGIEREYIHPGTASAEVMSASTFSDLSVELKPNEKKEFYESIKQVQETYVQEIDVQFGLPKIPLIKFKIKKAPRKTLKVYHKKTQD